MVLKSLNVWIALQTADDILQTITNHRVVHKKLFQNV